MSHQTLTYLKQRFEEVGLRLDTRHGQNFLIDLNLVRVIVDSAQLTPDDVVLEVGTGVGSLTALVAPQVAHVVTVEIDRRLHQLASEELIDLQNVTLLQCDALAGKHEIEPAVLDELEKHLGAHFKARPGDGDGPPGAPGLGGTHKIGTVPGGFETASNSPRRFKLVANLPYNIATPLVANLLALERPPELMVVTIQKELAERLVARPCTQDYSALSLWVQCQCQVEIIAHDAPRCVLAAAEGAFGHCAHNA